jgi:hypothetical protein
MYVKIEVLGIKEAMDKFDHNKVKRAAHSALNKVASQAKTQISQQIREEYNMPAGKLSAFLRLTSRASGNKFFATITGRGLGLALSSFGARQVGVKAGKKSGFQYTKRAKQAGTLWHGASGTAGGAVSVLVKRSSGRKIVSQDPRKGISEPFLVRFKSGHLAVVQRIGKGRRPLQELLGPGVAGLMGSKRIMDNTTRLVNEKFEPIFAHELQYFLSKK